MKSGDKNICRHCKHRNEDDAVFCAHCGRKLTTVKRDLRTLITDFLNTTFSLDKGFLPSFRDQWIPGKLSRSYFEPGSFIYTKPIKFFFISAIITFALQGISDSYLGNTGAENPYLSNRPEEYKNILIYQQSQDILQIDSIRRAVINNTDDTTQIEKINSYFLYFLRNPDIISVSNLTDTAGIQGDSIAFDIQMDSLDFGGSEIKGGIVFSLEDLNETESDYRIAYEDFFELKSDTLISKYKVSSYWQQIFLNQMSNLIWSTKTLESTFSEYIIWFLIANVPIAAIVLSLLYRRHARFYIEHIVFNLYTLATALYITLLINVAGDIFNSGIVYFVGFILVIPVFYFLSLYRYYGQGILKTSLKFVIFVVFALLIAIFLLTIYSIFVALIV